jgi:hypothetical protein
MSMMVEALPLVKEELDHESLRGVEMLRHLPMAVCQFDLDGNVMYQNPEAFSTFGSAASIAEQDQAPSQVDVTTSTSTNTVVQPPPSPPLQSLTMFWITAKSKRGK